MNDKNINTNKEENQNEKKIKNTYTFSFGFNLDINKESKLVKHFKKQKNQAAYIKALIEEDMKREEKKEQYYKDILTEYMSTKEFNNNLKNSVMQSKSIESYLINLIKKELKNHK